MRRLIPLTFILALALAAPAMADNVAYQGTDGNIWIATPDGARKQQVTTDGTAAQPYKNPTQTDDGRILSIRGKLFYLHNQNGSLRWAWVAPVGGSNYNSPINGQISPDGGTITWWFFYNIWIYDPIVQRVAFHTADGLSTSPCIVNCVDGYRDPRWIPGQPYAAFITTDGREVRAQKAGSSSPVQWVSAYDAAKGGWGTFEGFDIGRVGNKAIFTTTYGTTTYLESYTTGGPPPDQTLNEICVSPLGDTDTQVRFSPDTTQITWADAQGVWTSPAPTRGSGGQCVLNKKLIAAGGKAPDFGRADVPKPPSQEPDTQNPPPPPGDTPPGNTPPGDTPPGNTPPGDMPSGDTPPPPPVLDTAKPVVNAFKVALKKSVYTVTFKPNESGTAVLTVMEKKKKLKTLKAKVTGGKTTRFTYRSKKKKLTFTLVVKDAAGNATTKTLKR